MDRITGTVSNRNSGAATITMVVIHPTMGNAGSGATTLTVVVHPTMGSARPGAATLAIVVIHRVISTSKSGVATGKIFYVSWSHGDANRRHWIDME
jgi:hypothetical protein